jgi:sigma-B regulation protein RsbU (phosphoserine phosphatase)
VTLSIIILNNKTKTARYSGAGDLPLFFRSADGKADKFISEGTLLGFSHQGDYNDIELTLNSGDELFLVTDGIIEARNKAGELYEQERFLKFLQSINPEEDCVEQIKKEIFDYTGGEMDDDISVIGIKSI